MWWYIATIIYLIVGYFFKTPEDWKWYARILSGVLWLPMVLFVYLVMAAGRWNL